jgi:protein TonB
MKINKRFSAVLGASLALHLGVLFLAPGISPGTTAEKRLLSAPGKAFSLSNIALRPEARPPARKEPRRAVEESSPEGLVTEHAAETPSVESSYGVPAAFAVTETRENVFARYADLVRRRVDERKDYPYAARRQAQEGSVVVRFSLSRDGRLAGEPELEKSCRYQKLNQAALEAVRRASPYPEFPAELSGERLHFSLAISFSLREKG